MTLTLLVTVLLVHLDLAFVSSPCQTTQNQYLIITEKSHSLFTEFVCFVLSVFNVNSFCVMSSIDSKAMLVIINGEIKCP